MADTKKGFQEANVIAEGTFDYENIPNSLPPEPSGAIALWEEPNKLTLRVSNQASCIAGTPEAIKADVKELIEILADNGGQIIDASTTGPRPRRSRRTWGDNRGCFGI